MCKYDVTSRSVKIVLQPLCQVLVRKMAATRGYTLFQAPVINTASAQHIAAVVRFDKDSVASPELFTDQFGDMPKISQRGDPDAVAFRQKAKIINCIVRYCEWLEID